MTLWELLFGSRPFAGESLIELAGAVLDGRRRAPPKGRRVPSWLRRAIERGLASLPGDRFASMQALLDELARGQTRARGRALLVGLGVLVLLGIGAEGVRRYGSACAMACSQPAAAMHPSWSRR